MQGRREQLAVIAFVAMFMAITIGAFLLTSDGAQPAGTRGSRQAATSSTIAAPAVTTVPPVPAAPPIPEFAPRAVRTYRSEPGVGLGKLGFGEGALWVAGSIAGCTGRGSECGRVLRIDPATAQLDATIVVPGWPIDLAVGEGGAWVLSEIGDPAPYVLTLVDPATNTVALQTSLEPHRLGSTSHRARIATGAGAVWLVTWTDGPPRAVRVDPDSGTVIATIPLPRAPSEISISDHGVWIADYGAGHVLRLDPATNTVTDDIFLGRAFINALVTDRDAVWVAHTGPRPESGALLTQLARIEAGTRTVSVADVRAAVLATGDGQIWVGHYSADTTLAGEDRGLVGELDPAGTAIVRATHVQPPGLDSGQIELTVGGGAVWVLSGPRLVRITP